MLVQLAAFVVPASLCVAAQQAPEEPPECNPGRPTVATPATLTPVGYLQFEQGGLYASNSAEFDTQFSVNQVTKLTLNSRLELLTVAQPFARSRASQVAENDAGDVSAGAQVVLAAGAGKRPTVSASYIRLLRGGSAPDIDTGSSLNGATLLVSTDLPGLHFDMNGFANEQSSGKLRRAQFGQTVSVSHTVGRITIGTELWHFSQPLVRGNAVGSLWAVSYQARRNLVFDAGLNRGLTGSSTRWEGFAGFTYLLPHRLWKAGNAHRDAGSRN